MSLYWFGVPVTDVLAYWSDGVDIVARFVIEGDPRPRWALASMLETAPLIEAARLLEAR